MSRNVYRNSSNYSTGHEAFALYFVNYIDTNYIVVAYNTNIFSLQKIDKINYPKPKITFRATFHIISNQVLQENFITHQIILEFNLMFYLSRR